VTKLSYLKIGKDQKLDPQYSRETDSPAQAPKRTQGWECASIKRKVDPGGERVTKACARGFMARACHLTNTLGEKRNRSGKRARGSEYYGDLALKNVLLDILGA